MATLETGGIQNQLGVSKDQVRSCMRQNSVLVMVLLSQAERAFFPNDIVTKSRCGAHSKKSFKARMERMLHIHASFKYFLRDIHVL